MNSVNTLEEARIQMADQIYDEAFKLTGDKVMAAESRNQFMRQFEKCICNDGMQAMFCHYGHMTECHYPLSCEEAECSHYQAEEAEES